MELSLSERPKKPLKPYPGLRPFEPDEWPIFFGRDQMINEIVDRLVEHRLVFVHGNSGSGKSSLIRAGVIPRLARSERTEREIWRACILRPSGGPLWNLASALANLEGRIGDLDRVESLVRLCNRRDATLSAVAGDLRECAGKKIFLLIDQFEEIFRFAKETSLEEAEVFVDLITRELYHNPSVGHEHAIAHIVITMRSEFLGECASFFKLPEVINQTAYLVPRMDRAALMRAITRPAELFDGTVSVQLANRLIAETQGSDDELPLIQHALALFWDVAEADTSGSVGPYLDAQPLVDAGGVRALLSKHADKILFAVAANYERAILVEKLFRALIDINSDGQAIRRAQTFKQLVAVCGGPEFESDLRAIIDIFRSEGIWFITPYIPTTVDPETVIDVSHEAVIRCWDTVANKAHGWLKKEFNDGRLWASLVIQARRFEDFGDTLSAAQTDELEEWIQNLNEPWSERYGGGWLQVSKLITASIVAREESRKLAERKSSNIFVSILIIAVMIFLISSKSGIGAITKGDIYFLIFEYAEAKKAYEEVLSDPYKSSSDEAASYIKLAKVLMAENDLIGSVGFLEKAVPAIEHLVNLYPEDVRWQRDLIATYRKIGSVYLKLNQPLKARVALESARAVLTKLAAKYPESNWGKDLKMLEDQLGSHETQQ